MTLIENTNLSANKESYTPLSSASAHPFGFRALIVLLFIMYVAPQAIIPALQPLHLAKVTAAMAAGVYFFSQLSQGRLLPVMTTELKLIVGFVMIAVISIPFSQWPGGSFDFFIEVYSKSIIVFLLVCTLVISQERCVKVFWAIALFCGFNGLIAIVDFLRGDFFAHLRVRGGFSGMSGDPNDLALSLNMALPLVLHLQEVSRQGYQRNVARILSLICVAGVVATFSRGGFLGLAAVLLWFTWTRSTNAVVAFIKIAAVILLILILAPGGYSERLLSIVDTSKDQTGSGALRWFIMKESAKIAIEHPLGAGLKMHNILLKEVNTAMQGVHSAVLEAAADLGLAGAFLFLVILWKLLQLMRAIRLSSNAQWQNSGLKPIASALEGSLIAFAVSGMFLPVAYHASFYIFAALAIAIDQIAKHQEYQPGDKANVRDGVWPLNVKSGLLRYTE